MATNKKASTTQFMANFYPEWASTRLDEQSIGSHVLNVIGNQVDDLEKQVQTLGKNYFLPTANQDEIDLVYRFDLATTFDFVADETDPANTIFTDPTISGLLAGVWHSVATAPDNDIETFWYTSIPDRFDSTVTNSGSHVVLSGVAISGSPIESFDSDPHLQGYLYITISGGTQYINTDNNTINRGLVILEGKTRKGVDDTETMVFLFDSTQRTLKEWESLTAVKVYCITPDTATIRITSAEYNQGAYLDKYNLDHALGGAKVDTSWDLGTTVSGETTLDMVRFATEDFSNIVFAQLTAEDVLRQTELLDTSGINITGIDIVLQPFSDRAWVVTESGLYLYNTDRHLPSLTLMAKKDYDATIRIEVDQYHHAQYDEIDLEYLHVRPIKDIASTQVSIEKPDGTKVGLLNGTEVSITSDFTQFGTEGIGRSVRETDTITLDQQGDYIVTLEVQFTDLSIEIDQRIVSTHTKNALAEFVLSFTAAGVSFDSDQRLWIIDDTGLHHRIDLRKDIVLVDFEQKILFLHENYDEVIVTA